uniref:RNase E/G thioredoxin-like domain-containing protein n=1 Tax=Fundidesulfovibrio putealis TaxID=270496 RepID=A0A7C4EJ95_9BACT
MRQRMGSSAMSVSTEPCPCCHGTGTRRNMEWQALQVMREIYRLMRRGGGGDTLTHKVSPELAIYLLNQKRQRLRELEEQFQKTVLILPE